MGLGNLFSLPIIPIFPYSIIPSFHSFRRKTLTFRLIYFLINQSFLANTGGPLATHASALKRARQSEKKRLRNASIKSALKTQAKKVLQAVEGKNTDEARKALSAAIPALQKAAGKGVISKKTASRKISHLTKKVNSLSPPA